MANLIQIKSKSDTVFMNEVPVHPEEAIEKTIFETQNILPEVHLLKRQQNTYNNKERIDIIGLDNENNIVIIEIKDEMADASVLPQVVNYAMWVEEHPDAIKNLWYEHGQTPEDFDWDKEVSIRLIIVAPSFKSRVQTLREKFSGYEIELIEFKKFIDDDIEYVFLNKLPSVEAEGKARVINVVGAGAYTEEIYKKNFNSNSAHEFWKLANKLEQYVKAKNWNLTRANNKNYIAFKYGFPTVFGLTFVGSKSFCFFFKVPKEVAETIEIKGQKMYRYEDQWKQALYKVEKADVNLSLYEPLFEAAYKNIVGR